MKTLEENETGPTLAQGVAGEDLKVGEFISLLWTTSQYLSYLWDQGTRLLSPDEVVRVRYIPSSTGHPHKVVGVCLPFVYVKSSNDQIEVIDLRLSQVVRLDQDCAKEVWRLSKK